MILDDAVNYINDVLIGPYGIVPEEHIGKAIRRLTDLGMEEAEVKILVQAMMGSAQYSVPCP